MRTRAILTLCGISALWGSGWIFAPLLAEVAAPYAAAAVSAAVACVALAFLWIILRGFRAFLPLLCPAEIHSMWLFFKEKPRSPLSAGLHLWEKCSSRRKAQPSPSHEVPLLVTLGLGMAMFALPSCLMLFADRHGIGGWSLLLYALLPLLVALADQTWTAPMVAGAGAVLVLFDSTIAFTPRAMGWALPGLIAVALQAYGLRLAARSLKAMAWTALAGSLVLQLGLAAILLAACSLFLDTAPRIAPLSQWTSNAFIGLSWLALPGMVLAYPVLYRLLGQRILNPAQVAAGQWVQILAAVLESALFLHARPSWQMITAFMFLVVCTWVLLRPEGDSGPASIVLRDTPL